MRFAPFLLAAFAFAAEAGGVTRHVVFDIDWTILDAADDVPADPAKTLTIEGKKYRVAEGTGDAIAQLLENPDVQISFFSGGPKSRNLTALQSIRLPDGRTLADIAHKILSFEDLTDLYAGRDVPPGTSFSQRFKKDLTKIGPDLDNVVLVDDLANFALPGQNTVWLGATYKPFESFEAVEVWQRTHPDAVYLPPTRAEWERNHRKIWHATEILDRALKTSARPGAAPFGRLAHQSVPRDGVGAPVRPPTRIARFTDAEGNGARLDDYLRDNPDVFRDARGRPTLGPNVHFVFGGDAGDRGPQTRRILRFLLELKARYPDRVSLIPGNRDINKMRLPAELSADALAHPPTRDPAGYATWLAQQKLTDSEVTRLKWILATSMNAGQAFEFKRQELAVERSVAVGAVSDAQVLAAFREELRPRGLLFEYLRQAQPAVGIDHWASFHGAVTEHSLGYVPDRAQPFDDPLAWMAELNAFYRRQFEAWAQSNGERGAEQLLAYQAPDPVTRQNLRSTTIGRYSDATGNTQAVSEPTQAYLRRGGFHIVSVGHTPNGSTPTIVQSKDFVLIVDDNSAAEHDFANRVVIEGHHVETQGRLPSGEVVTFSGDVGDTSAVGRWLADGSLVVGRDARGDYVTRKVGDRFRTTETTVPRFQVESALGYRPHCPQTIGRLLEVR